MITEVKTGAGRRRTKVYRQAARMETDFPRLPAENESFRLLSLCDLTTIAVIRWIAERTVIRTMRCATFRVGPSALRELKRIHEIQRLCHADIIVGRLMTADTRKNSAVSYTQQLNDVSERYGWRVSAARNHTKIAIFDTDAGFLVLEGSCNLDDAPNWENFIISNDKQIYEFYSAALDEMGGWENVSDSDTERNQRCRT